MGMHCDETNGDNSIEGTEGCVAVLHNNGTHIEVWDED